MLDLVRTSLHRILKSQLGDGLLPVRLPKDLARRANMALGEPLCSAGELSRRRQASQRLAELRAQARAGVPTAARPAVQAPVTVYFDKERNARLLGRVKELLDGKAIAYTALEVDGATLAFVMREARCKEDDLPIVFVASTPVGGYNELVDWDVSGKLAAALSGGAPSLS
jgi:hypothetical protein